MASDRPGTVVVLNGTASAGKTSIAFALQEAMEAPYLEAGIDRFLGALPRRYFARPAWDEVLGKWTEPGPVGGPLVLGMHRAIAGLARAGINVVTDHVLIDPSWPADLARALHGIPAHLVAVRCPREIVVERERTRGDRTLGEAAAQYDLVHRHGIYDLEVDTGSMSARECVKHIRAHLISGRPPRAFGLIAKSAEATSRHTRRSERE